MQCNATYPCIVKIAHGLYCLYIPQVLSLCRGKYDSGIAVTCRETTFECQTQPVLVWLSWKKTKKIGKVGE